MIDKHILLCVLEAVNFGQGHGQWPQIKTRHDGCI
jgi:hypothetical protein